MSETPDQRELRFEELLRESAQAAAEYDESEEEIDHGAAQERSERQALRRVKGFSTELQDISEAEYRQLQLERVVLVGVWTEGSIESAENSLAELKALAETAEWMKRENVTLFEPAIAHGAYLVRVDVLIKTGNSIKLVEVKAKSIKSDDHQIEGRGGLKSAFKPYIEDIAFQKYVVGLAYPECKITSYLLMPDKTQTAVKDKMNQLFKVKKVGAESEVVTDDAAKAITFDQSLLHEFNVDH